MTLLMAPVSPYMMTRARSYTRTHDVKSSYRYTQINRPQRDIDMAVSHSVCWWRAHSSCVKANFSHERAFSGHVCSFLPLYYPRVDGSYYAGRHAHPSRAAYIFNQIKTALE